MIKVPKEDDECTSGYTGLDKAMYGAKDATKCFDVASENAMTAMGYDTLGPCTALGDVIEVRILNRIVRWVKPPYGSGRERIEY